MAKTLNVTVHDRTIIKLGQSWAISLPIDKMKAEGFSLGAPVSAEIQFDPNDFEEAEDLTQDIQEAKDYIASYDTWSADDLQEIMANLDEEPLVADGDNFGDCKVAVLIELKSQLKYMEKVQAENTASFDEMLTRTDDDFDYDKSGYKTIGLD